MLSFLDLADVQRSQEPFLCAAHRWARHPQHSWIGVCVHNERTVGINTPPLMEIAIEPALWPALEPISKEDATTDSVLPEQPLDIKVSMNAADTYHELYNRYWGTGKAHFRNLFVVREVLVPPLFPPKQCAPHGPYYKISQLRLG